MQSRKQKQLNQERHWDSIGSGYDDSIFDVFASDRQQVLTTLIAKYGGKSKLAIDFGCGTGKAFRYLCPAYKSVIGIDISRELLAVAAGRGYKNVSLRKGDLTKAVRVPPADFALCCNVIMLESMDQNLRMFRNIHRSLKKGAVALIVLPSLESFFYSANRLIEWHRREGTSLNQIEADEFNGFSGSKREIINGVVKIDGVPTKHYLKQEIQRMLIDTGFRPSVPIELEYDWTTEYAEPPKWMKGPYPWDWLVIAKKS